MTKGHIIAFFLESERHFGLNCKAINLDHLPHQKDNRVFPPRLHLFINIILSFTTGWQWLALSLSFVQKSIWLLSCCWYVCKYQTHCYSIAVRCIIKILLQPKCWTFLEYYSIYHRHTYELKLAHFQVQLCV